MSNKRNDYYKKEYEIAFNDIDEDYKCRITSIMNFFTDIALGHGEEGGIDFIEENANGIAQVYLDCSVNVKRYPLYREKIKITTNVDSMHKFYATRQYVARDSNGEIIFEGNALAVTIDMKKRRLSKIPERYYDIYSVEKKEFKKPERLIIDSSIDNNEIEKTFEIRGTDKDSNKHVNNVRYIEWALNVFESEELDDYEIATMNIKFEKEMQKDKYVKIKSVLAPIDDKFRSIYKFYNESDEVVTLMEFVWRKK